MSSPSAPKFWRQSLLPAGVAALCTWALAAWAGLRLEAQALVTLSTAGLVYASALWQAHRSWQPLLSLWSRLQQAIGQREETYSANLAQDLMHLLQHVEHLAQARRDAAGQLNAILAQINDGVVVMNSPKTVQICNPSAARLFGLDAGQAVGLSLIALVRDYRIVKLWEESQAQHARQQAEIQLGRNGQILHCIAVPMSHSSQAAGMLLIHDLTHARRLERARKDMISNISHELRTPLASIKALSDTLQEGALDDPPAARHFLALMQDEVDALTQLVAELMQLSRIESGREPIQKRVCDPATLLETAHSRMEIQARRKGIALTVSAQCNAPPVLADAERIVQVLVNLVHNAIKFTPAGGRIEISAVPVERQMVRFCVADTGIGIPAEALPRIFERFYKTDASRSREGSGLGLSICRHLVNAHSGKIWAESVEGKGSQFYFTLPQA